MGISVVMFGMIAFILLGLIVIPVIIIGTFGNGSPPLKFSYISFVLLTIQWTLYLTGFYVWLPVSVPDVAFTPIWFVICALALISVVREWKNNPAVSFVLLVLTGISFIFAVFIYGLSNM
ncbi:hypothetical protein SAMN04487944_13218 [Gracilibacillus ureilyticus]|uniref:Uncharacterized protein n=1 Tax=Gracilibacillus ureilyticus TaxID=531814 RepID=A0A1H9W1E6_9BACI|nr:hypothetical protein [Gracilibacillus ureilyticus]SES27780.1 hypothetical protein SAMN04487944_13218 [Gracilibacillus ureilyticus]